MTRKVAPKAEMPKNATVLDACGQEVRVSDCVIFFGQVKPLGRASYRQVVGVVESINPDDTPDSVEKGKAKLKEIFPNLVYLGKNYDEDFYNHLVLTRSY